MNFIYILDKSSKKFPCPECDKKTFVKYFDIETNNYLPDNFGRCDRDTNCGYHKAPPTGIKAYLINYTAIKNISEKAFEINFNSFVFVVPKSTILEQLENSIYIAEWFLKKNNIPYLGCESKIFNPENTEFVNTTITVPVLPEAPPSFHSLELVEKSFLAQSQNNFIDFLKTIFTENEVKTAIQNYLIGTSKHYKGAVVFWQIDQFENVRAGKIMQYNPITGKRSKTSNGSPLMNWTHSVLKLNDFNLKQCLFGLHLINRNQNKTIAIVESEKTAVEMSIFLPDYIWLATGSKSGFKYDYLMPVIEFEIIAFPDKGEFEYWSKKATELNKQGFKIAVSKLIENTNFPIGTDLADIYKDLKLKSKK